MRSQFEQKRVEPNSGLGKAFDYMLDRWPKFTLFLRVPGAPLTNNVCERALKAAIRHRNNSLFYRSQRGAEVGDMYMSLIYTAESNGENALAYLTALLRHARAVAERPLDWLPWNYRATLARPGSYRKVVSRGVAAGDPPKGAETDILHAGGVEGGPGGFRRRAVAEDLKGPGRGTAGAEPRRVGRPRSSQTRQSVAWTTSPVHRLPGMGNGRGGRGASTLSAYLPEVR
jgi:hypothetical protein